MRLYVNQATPALIGSMGDVATMDAVRPSSPNAGEMVPGKGDRFAGSRPSGPSGPFIVRHLDDYESSRGPGSDRSSSPDGSALSGDEDGAAVSPGVSLGGPVVIQAMKRRGLGDVFSVALVAGFLVPCFTVFAPLTVIGPLVCAAKYGVGSITPFVALVMGTFALPLYYSAYFKKVIWRPLMLELTNYVRPFRVIKNTTLPADKNYIVCWHPHGRLFYGFAVFCGLFDVFFPELNRREFFGAINEPLFGIPFLRNMLALTGTIGSSRKAIDRTLKRGDSVGLIVGGIEEVLEGTFDHKDVLYLKKRKGFVKVAMDQGAGLVPVYAFGENQLFCHEPPWVLRFWRWVNNTLKIKVGAPGPIRGFYGTPIPFRSELLIAVGDPLFAAPDECVDDFHARYVEAVQALFEQHVTATTRPNHRLVIV